MMNPTSVARYRKHSYSGPRKNRNRVRAALKHYYGDSFVSRRELCRIKPKQYETSPTESSKSSSHPKLKTYARVARTTVQCPIEPSVHAHKLSEPSTNTSSTPMHPETIWLSPEPELLSHEMTNENDTLDNLNGLGGYRIVDLKHVLRWAFSLETHRANCEGSTIEFVRELKTGLHSVFLFKCSMCNKEFRESNESDEDRILNKGFVLGALTGGHYTRVANVTDTPTTSTNTCRNIESEGDTWKEQLTEGISKVGKQERDIAIENGQINSNGIKNST